jgi:hypothetical protein
MRRIFFSFLFLIFGYVCFAATGSGYQHGTVIRKYTGD